MKDDDTLEKQRLRDRETVTKRDRDSQKMIETEPDSGGLRDVCVC